MWTYDGMQHVATKHKFIYVRANLSSYVSLEDASRLWLLQPQVLFHPKFRIAGTPDDVRASLTAAGYDEVTVDSVINGGITGNNYQTDMREAYINELTSYRSWYRSALHTQMNIVGARLFDVILAVNPEAAKRVRTKEQARAMGVAQAITSKRTVSLQTRIDNLQPGKVLDVSKLQPNGTGARSVNAGIARRYGSPLLPIVSADLDHYIMAVNMLPGGAQRYEQAVEDVRQQLGVPAGGMIPIPGQVTAAIPIPQLPPKIKSTAAPPIVVAPQEAPVLPAYPIFSYKQKQEIAKRKDLESRTQAIPIPAPQVNIVPMPGDLPLPPSIGDIPLPSPPPSMESLPSPPSMSGVPLPSPPPPMESLPSPPSMSGVPLPSPPTPIGSLPSPPQLANIPLPSPIRSSSSESFLNASVDSMDFGPNSFDSNSSSSNSFDSMDFGPNSFDNSSSSSSNSFDSNSLNFVGVPPML